MSMCEPSPRTSGGCSGGYRYTYSAARGSFSGHVTAAMRYSVYPGVQRRGSSVPGPVQDVHMVVTSITSRGLSSPVSTSTTWTSVIQSYTTPAHASHPGAHTVQTLHRSASRRPQSFGCRLVWCSSVQCSAPVSTRELR